VEQSKVIVFVVEDELLIQLMVEHALVEEGFAVERAATGEKAIEMLDAPGAAYRALITDINLAPGQITGWDVAKRGREINPDLPVVYMTGNETHDWASQGVPNSILVIKPFASSQIVTAVAQLLNLENTPGA
jgi:DNA-binding NtrC family response regulator